MEQSVDATAPPTTTESSATPLQQAELAVKHLQDELTGFQEQLVLARLAQTESSVEFKNITSSIEAGVLSKDDADIYGAAKEHLDSVTHFCFMAERSCHDTTMQLRAARHNIQLALLTD